MNAVPSGLVMTETTKPRTSAYLPTYWMAAESLITVSSPALVAIKLLVRVIFRETGRSVRYQIDVQNRNPAKGPHGGVFFVSSVEAYPVHGPLPASSGALPESIHWSPWWANRSQGAKELIRAPRLHAGYLLLIDDHEDVVAVNHVPIAVLPVPVTFPRPEVSSIAPSLGGLGEWSKTPELFRARENLVLRVEGKNGVRFIGVHNDQIELMRSEPKLENAEKLTLKGIE
jgi:hypothetical protein